MRAVFWLIITSLSFPLRAQMISIDTTFTPEEAVSAILMGGKSDILISNVKYTGDKKSFGVFINDLPEELIDSGLILSTGNVFDAQGPNDAVDVGSRSSAYRDENLQAIATSLVTDAAVLEFDLIALRDSLEFSYVFASEEYPEYVDKGVNDVFGFFITENGGRALFPRNIATLPNSRIPVSIDNVNHRRNEYYFLKSDFLHVHSNQFWEQHPRMALRSQLFQFDGFTVPLKAKIKLKEGQSYHFKIAIGDVGDRIYDSAVMIKAKSFASKGNRIPQADEIVKQYIEKELNSISEKTSSDSNPFNFNLRIQFNTNEALIADSSKMQLNTVAKMLKQMSSFQLTIIGHTDQDGSMEDNMELSYRRAKAVKDYLVSLKINPSRLQTAAKGESQPLVQERGEADKFLNRRVEFQFSY